jgi:hypothetical protein
MSAPHSQAAPAPDHGGVAARPPGDGECRFCGSTPAAHTTFQSFLTVIIYYQTGTLRGWMCRSCGLALFRRQMNRTLVGGWWGPGLIAIPIIMLANRLRLRRILKLAPPRPTPGVAAPVPAPMDPGKPVLARGGGIFGVILAVVSVLFIALVIAASMSK